MAIVNTNNIVVFVGIFTLLIVVIGRILTVKFRKKANENQYICKFLAGGSSRIEVSCRIDFNQQEIIIHDFSIPLWNVGTVVIPYIGISEIETGKTHSGPLVRISCFDVVSSFITNEYIEIIEKINVRTGKKFKSYIN